MIQVFDSGEMFNPICHGEIFKCQGGKALSQPVTVVGSTGEESWKCMLSTSNLQWPKKTFCEAQTCLAVAVTIDHLHLAFTTKSVWIQRYNLFQQSALRTERVPHSLPAGGRWDTRKCKSPPQFLFQMCLFRIMSNVLFHSSFQKISLWPTPVETEAKPKGQTWQFFQMQARSKQLSQSLSHF